jgi:hypothetical protein
MSLVVFSFFCRSSAWLLPSLFRTLCSLVIQMGYVVYQLLSWQVLPLKMKVTNSFPLLFPPTASKVKLQFGHQVTQGMAKHHGASSPFLTTTAALHAVLTSEINQWNPAMEASVEFAISCLYLLHSSPIVGLLLVLKHWNVDTAS